MATATKKIATQRMVAKKTASVERPKKSKFALFREKYPFGIGYEIVDMKAVLK